MLMTTRKPSAKRRRVLLMQPARNLRTLPGPFRRQSPERRLLNHPVRNMPLLRARNTNQPSALPRVYYMGLHNLPGSHLLVSRLTSTLPLLLLLAVSSTEHRPQEPRLLRQKPRGSMQQFCLRQKRVIQVFSLPARASKVSTTMPSSKH